MKMERKEIETVGIKVLRDNLSKFLERVALGVRILVTDRGKVIAELRAPSLDVPLQEESSESILREWARSGKLKPAKGTSYDYVEALAKSTVHCPAGTWKTILDKDRGE